MEENLRIGQIDALVVSTDEPQLSQCLEAVRNQTIQFLDIIHINNVVPENIAFNSGISQVKTEWFMKIDGDMILYPNALEMALSEMKDVRNNVYCCNFRIYDTFLRGPMRGCGIMNTEICRKVPYPNMLGNDSWFGHKLRKMGYVKINYGSIIGTHFKDADEFQIFRRFFCYGIKHGKRYAWTALPIHYEQTKNPLYNFALKAVEFGIKKNHYPTSHNIDFDRKMYEEFKMAVGQ